MKYGESAFCIIYLLLAGICGCIILRRARTRTERLMGLATLILAIGDAFHLIPRVINHFSDGDLTAALGIGKLVTSITMTLFYVLLYYIWRGLYGEKEDKRITAAVWGLTAVRIVLCLFPQNGWLQNDAGMTWGIIRNVPFTALGVLIVVLFFRKKDVLRRFKPVWLYVILSFAFYIPVAAGAGLVPMLGMLMIPKTVCYILLILLFVQAVTKDAPVEEQR